MKKEGPLPPDFFHSFLGFSLVFIASEAFFSLKSGFAAFRCPRLNLRRVHNCLQCNAQLLHYRTSLRLRESGNWWIRLHLTLPEQAGGRLAFEDVSVFLRHHMAVIGLARGQLDDKILQNGDFGVLLLHLVICELHFRCHFH